MSLERRCALSRQAMAYGIRSGKRASFICQRDSICEFGDGLDSPSGAIVSVNVDQFSALDGPDDFDLKD
jgi:hypothetical protein